MKLMVIDQSPLEGKAIEYILSKNLIGISYVGQTFTYIESLKLAESLFPDIVIINNYILKIYSYNILMKIKQIIPEVDIIVTSNYDEIDLVHKAFLYGAKNYILKPISVRDLLVLLESLIPKNGIYKNNPLYDSNNQDEVTDLRYEYCAKAKYYIDQFINQNKIISLESISSEVFISPFYLSRIFAECENINFKSYVIQRKMKKAELLLITSNQSIDNISKLVGYADSSSFRRQFKKEYGISAGEYRNMYSI